MNNDAVMALTNYGTIRGGAGNGTAGGQAYRTTTGATIVSLSNAAQGQILGGAGGRGASGGGGVVNAGTIGAAGGMFVFGLTNSGLIMGGGGGSSGGAGGAGVLNIGTIVVLNNTGTITGGPGRGPPRAAQVLQAWPTPPPLAVSAESETSPR